jgi:uncharacterized membrane protein YphA (DoxX/SURF4 family)
MLPLFYPSLLITALFFFSGFEKIYHFALSTSNFSKKMGIPLALAQLIIIGVIILEVIAPSIIALYTYSKDISLVPLFKLSVCSLISFTIVATILYHNPFKGKESYYAFMSNLSTLGGLWALYLLA